MHCLLTKGDPPRSCEWCGADLPRTAAGRPHRNRRWCRRQCTDSWLANHFWAAAGPAAVRRDGGCLRCQAHPEDASEGAWDTALEAHHVRPRNGAGYHPSCDHHLDGLETLCHRHHVEETVRQGRGLPTWHQDPRPLEAIVGELPPPPLEELPLFALIGEGA